ncbi:hypothetical protein H9P43_006277 [Blastocladiella emersonii ATCC 22665]|nr:hypothetical protein H9P43_006277 [Blastocladiella emersonii ATCC 22665]
MYQGNPNAILQDLKGIGLGFDPRKLLSFVQFPLDKYETLMRRTPALRSLALYGSDLGLDDDPEYQHIKNNALFVEQLQRAAAALTVQTSWRAHVTRLKYTYVRFGDVSNGTLAASRLSSIPSDISPGDSIDGLSTASAVGDAMSEVPASGRSSAAALYRPESSLAGADELTRPTSCIGLAEAGAGGGTTGSGGTLRVASSANEVQAYMRRRIRWVFGTSRRDFLQDLALQERVLAKYRVHASACESLGRIPPLFDEFCALKIQAVWRMSRAQRALQATIASIRANGTNGINYLEREHLRVHIEELRRNVDAAATKIQRAWRRFWHRRIYAYLRAVIRARERTDSRSILKFINPNESQLIDAAAGLHVRFRLGGENFPPAVYYKIYVHRPTIDLGSFAPRNYANPLDVKKKTWYKRFENNGWRPIFTMGNPYEMLNDPVYFKTTYKKIAYPALPSVRREEKIKQRKQRKVEWMRKMYAAAAAEKAATTAPASVSGSDSAADLAEGDDDDLLQWSAELDFDRYTQEWIGLATTAMGDEWDSALQTMHTMQHPADQVEGGESAVQETDDDDEWEGMITSTFSSRASSARTRSGMDAAGGGDELSALFLTS